MHKMPVSTKHMGTDASFSIECNSFASELVCAFSSLESERVVSARQCEMGLRAPFVSHRHQQQPCSAAHQRLVLL